MPTIIIQGYKFRFYSSDFQEPSHVHVLRGGKEAKIWLEPVSLQHNHGYSRVELNRILRLARKHQNKLSEVWYAYFNK